MKITLAWNVTGVLCALWLAGCASTTPDAAKTATGGAQSANESPDANADVSTIAKDLPSTLEGEIQRAELLRAKGDYEDAGRALAQMMLVAPDNAKVVGEYGKLLVQQGRPRDAIAFLDRAIQLQPKDWTLYSALGVAYDQADDHSHARLAYEHALALSPGEPAVLNNLAVSRMLAGSLPDAQKYLTEAATRGDSNPKIANNFAVLSGMKAPAAKTQPKSVPAVASAGSQPPVAHKSAPRPAAAAPKSLDAAVVMQRVPVDPLAGPVKTKTAHAVKLAHAGKKDKQAVAPPPALRTAAEAD